MPRDLTIVLAAYFTIAACIIWSGINGVRYARILRLDWPIYLESVLWTAIGVFTLISWFAAVYVISTDGLPETYKGVGYRVWIGLGLWAAFVATTSIGKHIAVRNAKRTRAEKRAEIAKMHNAMFSLRRELEKDA
jgi:hypothetical protein